MTKNKFTIIKKIVKHFRKRKPAAMRTTGAWNLDFELLISTNNKLKSKSCWRSSYRLDDDSRELKESRRAFKTLIKDVL